jgi:hypothetical protein
MEKCGIMIKAKEKMQISHHRTAPFNVSKKTVIFVEII